MDYGDPPGSTPFKKDPRFVCNAEHTDLLLYSLQTERSADKQSFRLRWLRSGSTKSERAILETTEGCRYNQRHGVCL